jgi:hypothetical protein
MHVMEHSAARAVVASRDFPRFGQVAMPILGYCLYVGGALLALLFVADLYIPKQAVREEVPHTYHIPIAAAFNPNQPITFSGQTRDFGAPPPMTVVDLAAKAPAAETQGRTPQALKQQALKQQALNQQALAPAAQREAKPVRKKVARRKVAPPENSLAQIPDEWRHRYPYAGPGTAGMAFARPFSW